MSSAGAEEQMSVPVLLLPGAVLPAEIAYADLIESLGPEVDARYKELEVYASDTPPDDYGLDTEVDGIRRFATAAGFERFHLVGYSGGGAAALVYCTTYPDDLMSLTLNEPAWAGNDGLSDAESSRWAELDRVSSLPPGEMMPAFIAAQLRPGVEPPPPPSGPMPPWMAKRPAGIQALVRTFKTSDLDTDKLRAFPRPVLFTLGGKSHPDYYEEIGKRLSGVFPDFDLEVFDERHHFDPPHRAQPDEMAELLRSFWSGAGSR
jgi:pimeloyl-ACP methyl ester carboxylesterase